MASEESEPSPKNAAAAPLLQLCFILLSALPFDVNAQTTVGAQAYWPTSEWRRATPEAQGLNVQALASLVNRIRQQQIRKLDSLLIVRNGSLVVEEYFNGCGSNDLHSLPSVTKLGAAKSTLRCWWMVKLPMW